MKHVDPSFLAQEVPALASAVLPVRGAAAIQHLFTIPLLNMLGYSVCAGGSGYFPDFPAGSRWNVLDVLEEGKPTLAVVTSLGSPECMVDELVAAFSAREEAARPPYWLLTDGTVLMCYVKDDIVPDGAAPDGPPEAALVLNTAAMGDGDAALLALFAKGGNPADALEKSRNGRIDRILEDFVSAAMSGTVSEEIIRAVLSSAGVDGDISVDDARKRLSAIQAKFSAAVQPPSGDDPAAAKTLEMTDDETLAVETVKAVLIGSGRDPESISVKKTDSYVSVHLDDNVRKWICRINLGARRKKGVTFALPMKSSRTVLISGAEDLAALSGQVLFSAKSADSKHVVRLNEDFPEPPALEGQDVH